jgi:hypothetical protein
MGLLGLRILLTLMILILLNYQSTKRHVLRLLRRRRPQSSRPQLPEDKLHKGEEEDAEDQHCKSKFFVCWFNIYICYCFIYATLL